MLEDLASHGYVIAAIDHPYDAKCVAFPDGRTVPFSQEKWDAAQKNLGDMMAYYASRIEVLGALDTRFVLEQVIREQQPTTVKAPLPAHRPQTNRGLRPLGGRDDGGPGERAR